MYAFGAKVQTSAASAKSASPSEELRVAVTFRRHDGGPGLTKFEAPLSVDAVKQFKPDPLERDHAIHELAKAGFTFTRMGRMSASMRCSRATFESLFGTTLSVFHTDPKQNYSQQAFFFPADDANWQPKEEVSSLIDDAYIQWPHIYMARRAGRRPEVAKLAKKKPTKKVTKKKVKKPIALAGAISAKPPSVSYFHLGVPHDVAHLLGADRVHAAGTTGKGVRVVMIDSGFAHKAHPFFGENDFASTVDLAPNATNGDTDPNGHGTGESANVFAVAPRATFIGVKVDRDGDPLGGATLLEGFQTALQHQPQVISVSLGYDLRSTAGTQLPFLPNSLAALEAEVQAAVAAGIVVVFSAGNGHFSFPGMMPDVISAGGVYVDETSAMRASDYASAFASKNYSGRHVPDFCGLVGLLPTASYIMLPVEKQCEIDRDLSAAGDGTQPDDGWGVFSGTSAAAPQLAGICALLLEKNPGLTPAEIKAILRRTARDVSGGTANPASSDDGNGLAASAGDDGATGAGLVDAFAAWQEV